MYVKIIHKSLLYSCKYDCVSYYNCDICILKMGIRDLVIEMISEHPEKFVS